MFLTICLFNKGMFAITVATTKIQETAIVEEDVEKSENSFTFHIDTTMLKNQPEVWEVSIWMFYDSASPVLCMYGQQKHTHVHQKMSTKMFIAPVTMDPN